MVGDRQAAARSSRTLGCALILFAAGCARGDKPAAKPKCVPPTDEKLGEFVRLQSEGVELYQQKKADEAIGKLEAAVKLNPCDVSIHNDLGIAYHQKHETKRALEYLKSGVEIDPLYPLSHLNLGIIYDEISNLPDAVKEFNEFLQLSPDFAEAYTRLGATYYKMSKYGEAKATYEKALKLKPEDAEIWYNLGNIASHDKDFAKAEEYYRTTLVKNPNLTEAHYKLASALQRLNREDEAKVHFEQFKKLNVHQARIDELQRILVSNPERAGQAHLMLGIELTQVGRYAEAIENIERSLKIADPTVPAATNSDGNTNSDGKEKERGAEAYLALSRSYRELQKFDEAMAAAEKAKALAPADPRVYDALMTGYSDAGKIDRAIEVLRDLIAVKPDYQEAWLNLGVLEQSRGNDKESIAALKKYAKAKPDSLVVHDALLAIYTNGDPKVRDKKKAIEEAKLAEQLGSTRFHFLAEAYHMNGDNARARALLEKGLADPETKDAAVLKAHLEAIDKGTPHH